MDNDEAIRLLEEELAPFRGLSYAALVDRMPGSPMAYQRSAPGGTEYQIEIEVFRHRPGEIIYVIGSIDDGGWRAFLPLTRSFIKSPDEPA